jgi:NAD(P)-dependent dehydrogenase (short-subunit alcohol dehydrogenase family)
MEVAALAEKNTVITGAASATSRELVLALSEAGANVLTVDRGGDGLSATCSMIVGRGTVTG